MNWGSQYSIAWLSGLAVQQSPHTAESDETLCTSKAGDNLGLLQFPGAVVPVSFQDVAILERAVHSLEVSNVSPDSPYLVSHPHQKGLE